MIYQLVYDDGSIFSGYREPQGFKITFVNDLRGDINNIFSILLNLSPLPMEESSQIELRDW